MRAHTPAAFVLVALAWAVHACGTKPQTPLSPYESVATYPSATAPLPDVPSPDLARCGSPLGAPNRRLTRFELAYAVEDVFGADASSIRALPRPHASIGYSPDILVGRLLDTSERFLEPYRRATGGIADAVAARIEKDCAKAQPSPDACVVERLREPAERLWRATAAADELGALATRANASSTRPLARALVKELLDSPRFYLLENELPPGDVKAARRRLASRLALALHASVPELELLRRAESGELEGPALGDEIRRLRGDAKFARFSREFVRQWLRADREPLVRPSLERSEVVLEPKRFEELEALAIAEFRRILDGGGSPRDLLAGNSGGLLASGLVKSALSAPIRGGGNESWLGRGILVEEAFLCRTFPLASVYPPELWDGHPLLSPVRAQNEKRPGELEMLATRTRDRPCRECHLQLETLGAALESESFPSKNTVAATDPRGIAGHALRGPGEVAAFVLESGRYEPCFSKKLLTYLLGRAVLPEKRPSDRCLVDALASPGDAESTSLAAMIERSLASPAFREQGSEVVHDTPNPPPNSQNYRTPLALVPSGVAECKGFDPGRFLTSNCGTKACHGPGGTTVFALPDRKKARTKLLWGGTSPSSYCDEHEGLVDLENPRQSLVVRKLVAADDVCGSPMPITSGPHSLSPQEVACFVRWVEKIAESERPRPKHAWH